MAVRTLVRPYFNKKAPHLLTLADTANDVLDYTTQVQPTKFSAPLTSREYHHGKTTGVTDLPWAGTNDWQQALKLADEGWQEGLNYIEQFTPKAVTQPDIRTKFRRDIGGAYASVPHYNTGDPQHMMTPYKRKVEHKRFVQVFLNVGVSWTVNADFLLRYATAVMSLIDGLENAGHSVEILQFYNGVSHHTAGLDIEVNIKRHPELASIEYARFEKFHAFYLTHFVMLKRAHEFMSPVHMAFRLAHPAWFRRFYFRMLENFPSGLIKPFQEGYGSPAEIINSETRPWDDLINELFYLESSETSRLYIPGANNFSQSDSVNEIIDKLAAFLDTAEGAEEDNG